MIRFIIFPLIVALGFGCSKKNDVDVSVHNNTEVTVDSVVVMLNHHPMKFGKIMPNSTVNKSIPMDSLQMNTQDVTVRVLMNKSYPYVSSGMHYNDLSGQFNDKYKITITKTNIKIE